MRLVIVAIALAMSLLLVAQQVTSREVARVIVFPGHPIEFSVVRADNASLLDAAVFTGNESIRLLGIPSGSHITWYRVALLSPSKFFSYAPILLSGDKVYVFGAQGTTFQRVRLLVGTLLLRELRGETTLIEPRISSNETLYVIPIGLQPVRTPQGFHVLYLVANLVETRSAVNTSYEDKYSFTGIAFFRIGLEKLSVGATLFPLRGLAVLAQRVSGGTVYVAGISALNISRLVPPPMNITLVIGSLRGGELSLHYYRVQGCDMPIAMNVQDDTLYLECAKPESFRLGLLAVNTKTWRIEWAIMYNVSAMLVGKIQPPLVMDKRIYVPIMNGLLVIDRETGEPLKALLIAATSTHSEPRVVGVNIWRIGNDHYVALINVEGKRVTLIPLKLVEKAKCIQVGSIALGETKIAPKQLKYLPLGTKTIQGKQLSVDMSRGPLLILAKYANVSEKEAVISYPENCKPQGSPLLTSTMTATTRTVTPATITTMYTSTIPMNTSKLTSTEQSVIRTGPTTPYSTTSSVEQSTSTPSSRSATPAITSTASTTSSTRTTKHRGCEGTALVIVITVLALIGAILLLMRRE